MTRPRFHVNLRFLSLAYKIKFVTTIKKISARSIRRVRQGGAMDLVSALAGRRAVAARGGGVRFRAATKSP